MRDGRAKEEEDRKALTQMCVCEHGERRAISSSNSRREREREREMRIEAGVVDVAVIVIAGLSLWRYLGYKY